MNIKNNGIKNNSGGGIKNNGGGMILKNGGMKAGRGIYANEDKLFTIINNILLFFVLAVVLFPLIFIINASFSSASAVMGGKVWLWPVDFTLKGYNAVFSYKPTATGYINTIFYTSVGTLLNLAMTIAAAYPLSRKDLLTRNFFMLMFAFVMLFSGGLIPSYIVISRLGLVNTRAVMLLPTALSVWNMIIMRTFFSSYISTELLESAKLDGCSDIKFLVLIALPLSGAIIAVIALFYAVGHWNSYFNAMIYLSDRSLYPLQLILREVLVLNTVDLEMIDLRELAARQDLKEVLKYSLIIVSSLPVMCIYPFVQKFFVKGVMIGSIKG